MVVTAPSIAPTAPGRRERGRQTERKRDRGKERQRGREIQREREKEKTHGNRDVIWPRPLSLS